MTQTPNHDSLLVEIVAALERRGLRAVALALLEVGQPIAFIGGQLLWLAQPAARLLWPKLQVNVLAQFMEDPTAVRNLMDALAADEATV